MEKKVKTVKRDSKGRLKKGSKAISPGRPVGVREKAREACKKFNVDPLFFFAELLADATANNKDRLIAARELADRMWGKPQQYLDVEQKSIDITITKPKDD